MDFGEPQPEATLGDDLSDDVRAEVDQYLLNHNFAVVKRPDPEARAAREVGGDWPSEAETMIGLRRLTDLARCVAQVVADNIPGDVIETGVWRGGACILMRGVLAALGETQRKVWVADSFAGLPKPDVGRYPADEGDTHWSVKELAVGLDEVRGNFMRYELLDEQVHFLKGWFAETLPAAPISTLSVLRVDGDMYGSTIEVLESLYPKLSVGGFCVIDDYGAVAGCRDAVSDFRNDRGIDEPMVEIDWTGVVWRRSN
jgi:O-methyltransferase